MNEGHLAPRRFACPRRRSVFQLDCCDLCTTRGGSSRRYAFEGSRLLNGDVHSFLDKTSEATRCDRRELKNEPRKSRRGSLGLTPPSAPLPSIELARGARSDRMDGGRCAPVVVRAPDASRPEGTGPKHVEHVQRQARASSNVAKMGHVEHVPGRLSGPMQTISESWYQRLSVCPHRGLHTGRLVSKLR